MKKRQGKTSKKPQPPPPPPPPGYFLKKKNQVEYDSDQRKTFPVNIEQRSNGGWIRQHYISGEKENQLDILGPFKQ